MSHFAHQLYEVAVLVDGEDIFDGMMTKVDRDYGVVGLNQFYHIQLLVSTKVEVVAAPPAAAPVLTGKLARLEQRERDKSPLAAAAAAAAVLQRKEPRFTVIKHWGRIGRCWHGLQGEGGRRWGGGRVLTGWASLHVSEL